MTELEIHFRRISTTHHEFRVVRSDGSSESAELETRSCLFHDLVHFAVETEAQLSESFYGSLATGTSYAALTEIATTGQWSGELATTESIVGPLQGWLRTEDRVPAQEFVRTLSDYRSQQRESAPPWLTVEFVTAVAERVRKLEGCWRGTPFGESMVLIFYVNRK